MSKLKLGYVGCGFMAQKVHLPNLAGIDTAELVAIAEVRPKLGRLVQARFKVPKLYTSHRELAADPQVQAVVVSGHFYGQGEIAIDLLRAGKDVLMEKPMAVTVEQAERMLAAEQASGKRLMIAYMKRYDAGNVTTKKLVDQYRRSGELGALRFVRNHGFCGDWTAGLDTPLDATDEPYPTTVMPWPDWLPAAKRDGYLSYLQQYTHNVNLLRWLLDAGNDVQVRSVQLDAQHGVLGVVVLAVAGVTTTIESGWVNYHGWDEHTQLYFEGGWVKTEAPPLLLRNQPATVEVYRGNTADKTLTQTFPADGRLWAYKEELRHFIDAVTHGTPFRSPADDALADVRTLEAIYRQHIA